MVILNLMTQRSSLSFNAAFLCVLLTLIASTVGYEIRPRFLILPGFGNDAIDYSNPLKRGSQFGFVTSLESRGYQVDVVPIQRLQWLNILWSIFSKDFFLSTCKPAALFGFYFKAVDKSVRDMNESCRQPIILIGHSAGGWLARGILGNGNWASSTALSSDFVAGLVTLGAPHLPPAEGSPDMTRGALRYVDSSYPGAYLCSDTAQSIFYLTVGGTAVRGDKLASQGSISKFASNSYQQVTGSSFDAEETVGDGVVPLSHAHLAGAEQITIEGCFHSIQSDKWYGGNSTIDQWLPQAMSLYAQTMEQRAVK
jgi:hypothetical protein